MDSAAIIGAVTAVTKKWTKVRKAEEREEAKRHRRLEEMCRGSRITIKEVAWDVMEAAYRKASSGGTLPAHARQIMYAARGEIQRQTGRTLDDQYFCQTLLPDYLNERPEQTASWDVVFDARGHFEEPHTGEAVPLGTITVRKYLSRIESHAVDDLELRQFSKRFPTCGPRHRFGAILFIEKEGFLPLLKAVRLAERYDLAIMSTKGVSVTASRMLIDELCDAHSGIPLLVLHDFDKSGFTILGTLRRDTRRYEFQNEVQVIDLGLRLADIEACGLEAESVYYGKSNPTGNLRENGATAREIRFLCGQGHPWQGYGGRRVELNAFTSGDFVAWIEAKLQQQGVKKAIPDDESLAAAYRRAVGIEFLNGRLREVAEDARRRSEKAKIPTRLARRVRERFEQDPALAWDQVIAALVEPEKP